MQIDELLHLLHHPESLNKMDEDSLKSLVEQFPYVDAIKKLYLQKKGRNGTYIHALNFEQRFTHLAANEYGPETENPALFPPVFELVKPVVAKPVQTADDPTPVPALISAKEDETALDQSVPLYPIERSKYVLFLKTLVKCKVHLEATPTIKPEQAVTDHLIENSLNLQEGIGSESLANLWALQGKTDLAIKIYEKLSAENPEKSSIFAAKIAKLKAENSL